MVTRVVGRCVILALVVTTCRGDDNPSGPPAGSTGSPNSATIGPAGGSVQATLDGGATIRLTLPAGAVADPVLLTLGPRPATAGMVGAFTLEPAGQRLAEPATLDIELGSGALAATSTVVFEQGGLVIPARSTRGAGTRSISVTLDVLGLPAQVAAASGVAGPAVLSRSSGGPANGGILPMTGSQRAQAAQAALVQLQQLGSLPAADAMQYAMDAFIGFGAAAAQADPLFASLVSGWRTAVCGDFGIAVNAMNAFAFSSDYAGLDRVISGVVGWRLAIAEMTALLSDVSEAGCAGLQLDAEALINTKLDALLPAIATDLDGFALTPAPQDSLFLINRLRPLLDIATSLALMDFTDAMVRVNALVPPHTVRLRNAGYAVCRAHQPQAIHARLMQLEAAHGVFAALSPYDENDLEPDVELCGMTITWELRDARDAAILVGAVLGGGDTPGSVLPPGAGRMAGDGTLHLSGDLHALLCPPNVSANNEQLEVRAGRSGSTLTRLALLSSSNNSTYLEASPLEIPTSAIRSAGGLNASDTGTVQVVVSRTGGTCSGQFAVLAHSPVGTIAIRFNGVSLMDSWEGTLTFDIPDAAAQLQQRVEQTSQIVVNVNGGQDPVVEGEYITLSEVRGPAGTFRATYDGRDLHDVTFSENLLCLDCALTAPVLQVSGAEISGEVTKTATPLVGSIQLTRRNATIVGGAFSGTWSGPMEVPGRGTDVVTVRFIQADDRVTGSWGASGFGLGHFVGTVAGTTFTYSGSDDAVNCRLITSGTMQKVAGDSITFSGTGTNCNGTFSASGTLTPFSTLLPAR